MTSDENLESDGRNLTAVILIAVFLFPFGYALLLGPAVWLYNHLPPGPVQNGIELVYVPLEWLDGKLPGQPFSKYVELWE